MITLTLFLLVIVFSIIDIIFCLITLAIYDSDNALVFLLSFFLTETILFFLLVMVEVIRFVFYLNPALLKLKGSQEKQSIDKEYLSNTEFQDNFSPFVTFYNLLEHLLKEYACELVHSPQSIYKLQFFETLDILLENGIINGEAYILINELRTYRNALVHSLETDKTVNPMIYEELTRIYELIKALYESRNDENKKVQKIIELNNYTQNQMEKTLEHKLIKYLKECPFTSVSEIAGEFGYSKTFIMKKLKVMQDVGIIQSKRSGKINKWCVKQELAESASMIRK